MASESRIVIAPGMYKGCARCQRVYYLANFDKHKCKCQPVGGTARKLRRQVGFKAKLCFLYSLWDKFRKPFQLTLRSEEANKPGNEEGIEWHDGIDFEDYFEAKTIEAYQEELRRGLSAAQREAETLSRLSEESRSRSSNWRRRQTRLQVCCSKCWLRETGRRMKWGCASFVKTNGRT